MRDDNYSFKWANIGDVTLGRPNLGDTIHGAVYRLMQHSIRSILNKGFGGEKTATLFSSAGHLAGMEFSKNILDINLPFNSFVMQLQNKLKELNMGILRIEKLELKKNEITLVVTEGIDCSGLPVTDETVCDYEEGFIAGILDTYTGKKYDVKKIDCWSNDDRACRFEAKLKRF
jgi:predicted hydrocarbon binding protein